MTYFLKKTVEKEEAKWPLYYMYIITGYLGTYSAQKQFSGWRRLGDAPHPANVFR